MVQHPFSRPEFLSWQKVGSEVQYSRNVNCPQGKALVLGPKEKMARKPVQGTRPWTSLMVYVGHNRHVVRPDYDMIPPEDGEKIHQSQEDSPEFQAIYVPREELSCPVPARLRRPSKTAPQPSKNAPQPVIDASVVTIWRWWITPILTLLQRKAGSRHCKRGREQPRDTLIRRVAGTVGCICAHMLWWGRERKGEACLLTLRLLELNIRTPVRGFTRGRGFTRSRGGLRNATGKENGWLLFTHLKPRAEGYETEILTNYIQIP